MGPVVVAGVAAAVVACGGLFYVGGVKAVACGVVTGVLTAAVLAYAFLPLGDGSIRIAASQAVGMLPGGEVIPIGLSLIPAGAWNLVSRVHPRSSSLGRFYAVLYCVLVALCSFVAGALAVGLCFPKQARWAVLKVLDWLPPDSTPASP